MTDATETDERARDADASRAAAPVVAPAPPSAVRDEDGPVPAFVADPDRANRLLKLRVAMKSMIAFAFAVVVFVFFSAFLSDDGEEGTLPGYRVAVGDMTPGETRMLNWDGRAVLVHRRTAGEIARLEANAARGALRDPESAESVQPEGMRGGLPFGLPGMVRRDRSRHGLGLPDELPPARGRAVRGRTVAGRLSSTAAAARATTSPGAVYARQYADRNLVVPPHVVHEDGTLLLGG